MKDFDHAVKEINVPDIVQKRLRTLLPKFRRKAE